MTAAPAPLPAGAAGRRRTLWLMLTTLLVIAAALAVAMALIFGTVEAERAERAQMDRTIAILSELRTISQAATNAETGQRGYMLTLDKAYLEPFHVGQAQFAPAVRRMRAQLGEDATAEQSALLDRIEQEGQRKFAELNASVALVADGRLLEARRALLTDEGQAAMLRLRDAVARLERIENDVLDRATADAYGAESMMFPLLAAVSVLIVLAMGVGFLMVGRTANAEAAAAHAAEIEEARDRADLLAKELNHRVKNLFAVILAIVRMSGRGQPEAKPAVDAIAERIHALLSAHEVTQSAGDRQVAALGALVERTLAPYLSPGTPATIAGPEVTLDAQQITPLGLVLHELATNAVKYGCWNSGGALSVTWQVDDGRLALAWREDCPGDGGEPASHGFGSMMMTSAARQLRGNIERRFTASGLEVDFAFPLHS